MSLAENLITDDHSLKQEILYHISSFDYHEEELKKAQNEMRLHLHFMERHLSELKSLVQERL